VCRPAASGPALSSDGRLRLVGIGVPWGELPSGTVTFLFSDVEGSTALWMAEQVGMSASLAVHDTILRSAIESVGGYVFSTAGDSLRGGVCSGFRRRKAARRAQDDLKLQAGRGPHCGCE